MRPHRLLALVTLCSALVAPFGPRAAAAESVWQDGNGGAFRGEPAAVLGAFALFRTSDTGARRVPLRSLAPAEAVRFAQEVAAQPAAAGLVARDLDQGVCVLENGKLVPAARPAGTAPEILVVFYGGSSIPAAWSSYWSFTPTYRRLRAVFGDRFEMLLFGTRTSAAEHRDFAIKTYRQGLITDFAAQRAMPTIARFAPADGARAVALSRSGVLLASSPIGTLTEVRHFVDEVTDLFYFSNTDNPATWPDRLAYFNTVRPVLFAESAAPPLLIASPLRDDILRRHTITTVAARIEVDAAGQPSAVEIGSDCDVPAALRTALADGLRRTAQFSPAIDHGRPVAAGYEFRHPVPPAPACSAAELAWINGDAAVEISLPHWLLLRPIPVPEQAFTSVDQVDENGMNILTPFEVSDERIAPTQQRNSFNSDWFADTGAAAVAPFAGKIEVVDGHTVAWESALSRDGFVELRSTANCDYSIGYAWTELEVREDTDAWLAIGSDDGLKIWLDGQLVHDRWIRRISLLDDDIVPLHLHAGKNRLLLKIQNAIGDWNFVARLRRR